MQPLSPTKESVDAVLLKVRPYIQSHGGDVTFVRAEEGVVELRVDGACTHCPLAELTYNKVIRTLIIEDVPGATEVIFS